MDDGFAALPWDVLDLILARLGARDAASCCVVCRAWVPPAAAALLVAACCEVEDRQIGWCPPELGEFELRLVGAGPETFTFEDDEPRSHPRVPCPERAILRYYRGEPGGRYEVSGRDEFGEIDGVRWVPVTSVSEAFVGWLAGGRLHVSSEYLDQGPRGYELVYGPSDDDEPLPPGEHVADLIAWSLGGDPETCGMLRDLAPESGAAARVRRHLEGRPRLEPCIPSLSDAAAQALSGQSMADLLAWCPEEDDPGLDRRPERRSPDRRPPFTFAARLFGPRSTSDIGRGQYGVLRSDDGVGHNGWGVRVCVTRADDEEGRALVRSRTDPISEPLDFVPDHPYGFILLAGEARRDTGPWGAPDIGAADALPAPY